VLQPSEVSDRGGEMDWVEEASIRVFSSVRSSHLGHRGGSVLRIRRWHG
jgi:hypothetical protein